MNTHYYNAFHQFKEDTGTLGEQIEVAAFFIEGVAMTRDEALEDISGCRFRYAYTLEVGLEETKRMDLESEALNQKYDIQDEHDKLVEQGLA